jgi:hypothetical protein
MIQQDKLVRLQYEWNEGNLKLEGIESNFDIYPMYDDIFACKFLSEVTKEEVDMMSEFIVTNKAKDYMNYYHAHDYVNGAFTNTPDSPDYEYNQLPPYHKYRLARTGEKPLSIESLVFAKKEEDYIDKHHKYNRETQPELYNRTYPVEPRPMLHNSVYEDARKFIQKFEDQKALLYYEAWHRAIYSEDDIDEHVESAVWHLQETNENHSLEANDDWRQSILNAAEKSKKEKTAHALYLVYEEYLQSLKKKKTYMPITAEKKGYGEIWGKYKESVLHGREVSGEPRDFNF